MAILAFLAIFGSVGPAPAVAASASFEIMGPALEPCSSWVQDRQASNLQSVAKLNWVLGFVSAYNEYVAPGGNISHGQTPNDVGAWIDRYCQAHPVEHISRAARALVEDMEARAP